MVMQITPSCTRPQALDIKIPDMHDNSTQLPRPPIEEFGLTEIYAQVTATCDATKPDAPEGGVWTFGYQIFRRSTCEGNPFGFEVKQSGMELDECAPLELPFVDNQVDFTFVLSSDAAGVGESVKQEINSVISEIEGIEDASIKDASIAAGESVKQEINSVISEIEGIGDASSAAGTLTCQTVPFAIFVLVAPLITTVLM